MFQLSDQSFEPQPSGNLIKASQYQCLLTAQELVAAAQRRAQQIVDDAQHEWQRQHDAGYQTGMLQAQESSAQLAIVHHRRMLTHLQETQQQLVNIVMQAVTKIIGDLPDVEVIGRLIDKAMAELVGQNRVKLLVHPDNLATVDQLSKELCARHTIEVLELNSDPRVPLHTCVLSTARQVIDASLEVQLGTLRQLLAHSLVEHESAETR